MYVFSRVCVSSNIVRYVINTHDTHARVRLRMLCGTVNKTKHKKNTRKVARKQQRHHFLESAASANADGRRETAVSY